MEIIRGALQLSEKRVRDIMTSDVAVLPSSATLAEGRDLYRRRRHGAYPVVDEDGRCVGMLSRDELLLEAADERTPVGDVT